MALYDIEQYELTMVEVARILKQSGRFVFSIPHPCFNNVKDGMSVIGWKGHQEGKNTSEEQSEHLEVTRYFDIGKHEVVWDRERIHKPFRSTAFHWTLIEYFEALHANGMLVSRLAEPRSSLARALKRCTSLPC